jgi:MFS family permease
MKFLISLILIALLSFAACLFLPWWSIAVAAFIVAVVIPQHPGKSFLAGFLALFFLWGVLAYWISDRNENILEHKVSMLMLKMDNPFMLILVTALIGALVAGFAALSGSFLRKIKNN